MPTPQYSKEIEVLIPADLNDPLKLNKCEIKETSELCHHLLISPNKLNIKRNKRRRTESDSIVNELKDELVNKRLKLDLKSAINLKDKIVSPVVPQNQTDRFQNSNSTVNHLNSLTNSNLVTHKQRTNKDQKHIKPNINNLSSSSFQQQIDSQNIKQLPNKQAQIKQSSKSEQTKRPFIFKSNQTQFYYANGRKFNLKDQKFQFGNYNRYYGYRNQNQDQDLRLSKFKKEWFFNKSVLDIGCNVGHVTCWIGRNFDPKKIIGLDIDAELIKTAKRNISHYLENADVKSNAQFPVSLSICHGPLVEKEVNKEKDDENVKKSVNQIEDNKEDKLKESKDDDNLKQTEQNIKIESTKLFPKNVSFVAANYVLPNDLLSMQKPEYDCILCLSVTKWVHLNFGDEGVKNLFKRVYLQLKSNGIFILEPQHFWTYKSKKALTVSSLYLYIFFFL